MSKWSGVLSTTGPYNNIGVKKVRQGNKQSETFTFRIVQNTTAYNLTGLTVYFCTHFEPAISVEKPAVVIDAKNGTIEFTMDDDCMQKVGNQEAYFEIYRKDERLDSTQNFTYTIQTSILKQEMDGQSYIQRLEDLLTELQTALAESAVEIEEWLANNRQEVDQLLVEMQNAAEKNQQEFNAWLESVKTILANIDPGGVLLSEIINARDSQTYGKFNTLDERLENSEQVLAGVETSQELVILQHDLGKYPSVLVTSLNNGLGITGIGTSTAFGSIPETIPNTILYPDSHQVIVKVQKKYGMATPTITETEPNSYLLVEDNRTIRINIYKEEK